jgi:hypothetical protein
LPILTLLGCFIFEVLVDISYQNVKYFLNAKMHRERTVKVDSLLLLRYYHIFFYLCSGILFFAGANAKPDRIGLGESKSLLSYLNCTIFLFL